MMIWLRVVEGMVKPMVKGLEQAVIELLRVLRVKAEYTREISIF